jgi:hypothetical protein
MTNYIKAFVTILVFSLLGHNNYSWAADQLSGSWHGSLFGNPVEMAVWPNNIQTGSTWTEYVLYLHIPYYDCYLAGNLSYKGDKTYIGFSESGILDRKNNCRENNAKGISYRAEGTYELDLLPAELRVTFQFLKIKGRTGDGDPVVSLKRGVASQGMLNFIRQYKHEYIQKPTKEELANLMRVDIAASYDESPINRKISEQSQSPEKNEQNEESASTRSANAKAINGTGENTSNLNSKDSTVSAKNKSVIKSSNSSVLTNGELIVITAKDLKQGGRKICKPLPYEFKKKLHIKNYPEKILTVKEAKALVGDKYDSFGINSFSNVFIIPTQQYVSWSNAPNGWEVFRYLNKNEENGFDDYPIVCGNPKTYVKPIVRIRNKANAGNAHAQYELGIAYCGGGFANRTYGLDQDLKKCVEWMRKSAESGSSLAQEEIGYWYASGIYGFPKDSFEATKWYQKAADQGSGEAKQILEEMEEQHRAALNEKRHRDNVSTDMSNRYENNPAFRYCYDEVNARVTSCIVQFSSCNDTGCYNDTTCDKKGKGYSYVYPCVRGLNGEDIESGLYYCDPESVGYSQHIDDIILNQCGHL